MANTPVVMTNGNVQGNIGSCEIKTSEVSVSSFYKRSIALDSCTGQIVSDNTYYDWEYIYVPGVIIVIVLFLIIGIKIFSDNY